MLELWGLIDGKDVKLNENDAISISTYAKRKSQALNFILQSLFNNQLFIVKKETTTKGLYGKHSKNDMWTKSSMNTLFLTRIFFTFQMGTSNKT
jgi:hypothetical protein